MPRLKPTIGGDYHQLLLRDVFERLSDQRGDVLGRLDGGHARGAALNDRPLRLGRTAKARLARGLFNIGRASDPEILNESGSRQTRPNAMGRHEIIK